MALASSSAMPGCTWSAIRCTALRVRALTSISASSENFSPVPSSSVQHGHGIPPSSVVGRRQWSVIDVRKSGWLRKSLGASAATTRTSTGPPSAPSRCGRLASKCAVVPARAGGPRRRTPAGAAPHDVDPLLAAVAGRLGGTRSGLMVMCRRLEGRGAGKPAAGRDGQPVGLVGRPARRVGGDGGRALALAQEGAHGDAERPGQSEERGDGGLALTRLEAGEMGGRELGPLGQLLEGQAGPGALLAQALGDGGQGFMELHGPIMGELALKASICQSSRVGNVGETAW